MNSRSEIDWPSIRDRAAEFPEDAFEFVRDGLKHTVSSLHGPAGGSPESPPGGGGGRRHVSGQQLCLGLKDLAIGRWGLLTPTVFRKWRITRTDDFGTMVYAMIDRGELKSGERDSFDDFKGVYEFDEAFGALKLG